MQQQQQVYSRIPMTRGSFTPAAGGAWVPDEQQQQARALCQCHEAGYQVGLRGVEKGCPHPDQAAEALMWRRGYYHGALLRRTQRDLQESGGIGADALRRALDGDR